MKQYIYLILVSIILSSFLSSCSTSRFLKEGEVLYTGIDVKFKKPAYIDNKKELKELIKNEIYPKPADKFLGIAYTRQWMYVKVNPKPGKSKGLKYKLKYKFGEKPVLITDINEGLMNQINVKTMQDNGFFHCASESEVTVKKTKGKILYTIDNGYPSNIDSIIFPNSGSEVDQLISSYKYLRIKEGKRYNLRDLTTDREELATYIRNSGYYDFDQQDLFYLIDTTGKSPDFDVYFKVRPPKNDSIHRRFFIRNVNVYVTNQNAIKIDSTKFTTDTFKGMAIHHEFSFISNKTIYANTIIEPEYRFSIDAFNYTYGRFINMEIFDFVNVNYTKVTHDRLDVDIILNPSLVQDFSVGIEVNTSNRSFLGGNFNVAYINKNVNKQADRLTTSVNFGTELQRVKGNTQFSIFNYGGEVKYEVPRLTFFLELGKLPSERAPITFLAFKYNHQQWLQFYTLNSIDLSYGYEWTNSSKFHHEIKPISFNIIDVSSTTPTFQKTLDDNPLLAVSFSDQIILGSQYKFSFNTKRSLDQKSYLYYQNYFEIAGNSAYAINRLGSSSKQDGFTMFGTPFAQFIKDEIEIRFHKDISTKHSFVARIKTGVGYAYGNSQSLPFTKKFFAGGPNTLRGFGFRSIGPGRYTYQSNINGINPIQQSGDISLLLNAEYRFPIVSIFKGAFFADAGNIWLVRNDPDRPSGVFKLDEFYRQLAFNSGFGLRLDLGFFVLRGDVGIPMYKPYELPANRWIDGFLADDFNDWRKQNMVLNIAIGYPF